MFMECTQFAEPAGSSPMTTGSTSQNNDYATNCYTTNNKSSLAPSAYIRVCVSMCVQCKRKQQVLS